MISVTITNCCKFIITYSFCCITSVTCPVYCTIISSIVFDFTLSQMFALLKRINITFHQWFVSCQTFSCTC